MHILDVSTKHHTKDEFTKKMQDFEDRLFNDISRAVKLQNGCQLESYGWYVDRESGRVHILVKMYSDNPSMISNVCEIIEDKLRIPSKFLNFLN